MVSNIYPPGSGFPNTTFTPKPSPPAGNPGGGMPPSFGGAGTGSGGVSPPGGGPATGSGGSPMSTGPSPGLGTPRPPSIGGGGSTSFGGGGPSGGPVSGPVTPPAGGPSSGPIINPPTGPSSVSTPGGPPPSSTSGPPSKGPGSTSAPGTPSGTSVGPAAAPSSSGLGQNMGTPRGIPPPPSSTTSGTGTGDGTSSTTAPTPGTGTGTGGGLQQKTRNGPATGKTFVPPEEAQQQSSTQQAQNSAQKSAEEIKNSVNTGNATNPGQLSKPPNNTGSESTDNAINNATKNAKKSTEGSDGADSSQARTRGEVEKINNAANEAQKNAKKNPKSGCTDCGTDNTKGPGDLDTGSVDAINDTASGDAANNTDSDSGDSTVPDSNQGDDGGTDGVTTPEGKPDVHVPWEYAQANDDLSAYQFSLGSNHSKKKTDPNDPYGGYFADSANTVDAVADNVLGGGSDFRQNPNESLADALFRWQQDPNRDYDPSGKADWIFTGKGSMQSYMHSKGYDTYGTLDDFGNDSASGPSFGYKGSTTTQNNKVKMIDAEIGFGARRMDPDSGDLQGLSATLGYQGPIGPGSSDFSDFTGTQPNFSASLALSVSSDDLHPFNAPGKLADAAIGIGSQLGSQVADNFRNKGFLEASADLGIGAVKTAGKIGLGLLGGGISF